MFNKTKKNRPDWLEKYQKTGIRKLPITEKVLYYTPTTAMARKETQLCHVVNCHVG
jgi:hypothetical protein